jgi:uncharacterized membrane protein YedE/YeeE
MSVRRLDATVAGILLGLVLLASFVVAGRGIGASGAFAAVAAQVTERAAPGWIARQPSLADRMPADGSLADSWIVWQVVGLVIGGAVSARLRRRDSTTAHDPPAEPLRALAGGALMGLGARLAWGCTSGLALSGGSLLATGAWTFVLVAFGTGILVHAALRRA